MTLLCPINLFTTLITYHTEFPTTPSSDLKKPSHTIKMSTNQYDAPSGDVVDDDYKSRTGQSEIPVQSDSTAVEATEYDNGGDSDKQLGTSKAYMCNQR
jgi:hypothetical protein